MQQVELSVSFVLRATCSDIRDTLPHDIAHAVVGPATDTTRVIDPTAAGTVKRPSADLRRSPAGGRLFRPTLPPLLTTRPRGSLEQPPESTSAPATFARSLARSRSRRGKSSAGRPASR